MDSGVAPHHSCHLAGLMPSTFPSPLGERVRQSRQTTSHIDSHMMGDHVEGIPEPPFPFKWKMESLLLTMILHLI